MNICGYSVVYQYIYDVDTVFVSLSIICVEYQGKSVPKTAGSPSKEPHLSADLKRKIKSMKLDL